MHTHNNSGESCAHGARHARGGFGRHGFKPPFGMGDLAQGFGGFGGGRARRGDVRTAVLRLLSEAPMHGYQIIQELRTRSGGTWTPSPGSVYPTLQLLADEGLVSAEEASGKKVFSLTETGTAEVAKTADQPAPWEEAAQSDSGTAGFRETVGRLMPAVFHIGKDGSPDQIKAAIEILDDARKKLYAILAEG
ncbi:MAG: PadR family transcriptional regulator [Actinomycetota bacterium]|nr:PadR family transcriptional regulator [Actinomycetota bacterium]